MATEIRVPTLGESVSEATVGKWFKKVGDQVAADEPLVELETDKVTLEVPAPGAGTLAEIIAGEGANVGVDAVLGIIADGAAGAAEVAKPIQAKQAPASVPAAAAPAAATAGATAGAGVHSLRPVRTGLPRRAATPAAVLVRQGA
jgi:2-oxoglutarate dehydrogenase E2 component (dihydrolipoamide succinyltransferase)